MRTTRTFLFMAVPLALACGGGDPTGDGTGTDLDVIDPDDPAVNVETEGTLVASGYEDTALDVDGTMMAQALTAEGIELRLEAGMHNVHFRSGTGFVTPILGLEQRQDRSNYFEPIGATEVMISTDETVTLSAGERCTDVVDNWSTPDGVREIGMQTTEDGRCGAYGFSPNGFMIGDGTATAGSGPCQGSVFQIVDNNTITVDCGVGVAYTHTRLTE